MPPKNKGKGQGTGSTQSNASSSPRRTPAAVESVPTVAGTDNRPITPVVPQAAGLEGGINAQVLENQTLLNARLDRLETMLSRLATNRDTPPHMSQRPDRSPVRSGTQGLGLETSKFGGHRY